MEDTKTKYRLTLAQYMQEIKQVETKAKRAMRITLWLKIILSIATVSAVGAWLKGHGAKEVWAFIIVLAELADAMMNTLPYAEQRTKLLAMKIKLTDVYIEMEHDLTRLENGLITEDAALEKYFAHRDAWGKALA